MPEQKRTTPASEPRIIALSLLRAVLREETPLDTALAQSKRLARLTPRDRAFARNLVAGTLRRLGQLDAVIDQALDRPLKSSLADVQDLLRLGAYQLLVLKTPAHAAVSATVALARGRRLQGYRGLVNAVLRRIARDFMAPPPEPELARLCTPAWLWDAWTAAYGDDTARAIASAHLREPPLDLTVKADPETWAETLGAERLPTGTLRLPPGTGDVARLPGYDAGAWWVQDAAAALPARLLGDIAGQSVIDLCAAPGGKTAQLANAGARVIAVDRAPARLETLRGNLQRLDLQAAVVEADATTWHPPEPADAVLLDAPCSSTGTLRRHPDIGHLKGPESIPPLLALQDRLLAAAVEMLRPGGVLVYATCSLQPEEGPARIAALLDSTRDSARRFERLPITPADIGGLGELITAEGDLRSLPCHLSAAGGIDGFYACRLIRH